MLHVSVSHQPGPNSETYAMGMEAGGVHVNFSITYFFPAKNKTQYS